MMITSTKPNEDNRIYDDDDDNDRRTQPAVTDPYRLVAPSDRLIELFAGAALHARPSSTRAEPPPPLAAADDEPCTQQKTPSSPVDVNALWRSAQTKSGVLYRIWQQLTG